MIEQAASLARKVALIADECSYVQKDGRNDFHKYRYASAAAVLAKVNEAMAKHGVCSTVDPAVLSESDNAGNRTVTVKVVLTLHDADSDQTLTTAGIGCGQDKGDKAVMKAQTAAIKYAWMLALNISTGDDPEADDETDKRNHEPARPAPTPRPQPPVAPRPAAPDPEMLERQRQARAMNPPTEAAARPDARLGRDPGLIDLWSSAEASRDALASVGLTPAALPADEANEATLTAYVGAARRAYAAKKAGR